MLWMAGRSLSSGNTVIVDSVGGFGPAIAGVITLPAGTAYEVRGDIDLGGARLSCAGVCAIYGSSSETSSLTSTGLSAGTALITSSSTLRFQNVTIKDVGTALSITGSSSTALDWNATNFSNVDNIGTINGFGNLIITDSAFLSAQGLVCTGSFGTLGISDSLLQGTGSAGTIISVPSGATVSRRVRIRSCAVVASGSTVGVDVDASATIPDESFILDTVNFSGGGTYLGGLDYTSNKALFLRSTNVVNTAVIGNLYMQNNSTATTLSVGVPAKMAGTTTASTSNQKFDHAANRLTYTGAFAETFQASAIATLSGSSNKVVGLYFAKNGAVISETEMYATLPSGGRLQNLPIQGIFSLSTNDYVEVFVENSTDSTNVTGEFLNMTLKRANE